jgi:pyruvate/2-oxoglutarate dehydrogenase complex dihydrolipoamide acyltransferase (E2) component
MSSNEERAPLGAAPDSASPQTDEAPVDDAAAAQTDVPAPPTDSAPHPHDALSPSVRRLVRQFDLDITGIHGTGPEGRIRVGDVMSLLAGRTDSGNRDAPTRPGDPDDDSDAPDEDGAALEPASVAAPPSTYAAAAQAATGIATTTVFDCDLSRVLSHRKKLRRDNVELLTTSYFLTALAAALDSVPEITAGHAPRFGVALSTADGALRSALVDIAAVSWDAALDERVRAIDAALRANLDAELAAANVLVHHYGESGSLVTTPTPIGAGHAASVGIGRVRREIVVRTVDGVESPRVAARCYLSLSFFAEQVPLHHANRVLAEAVRALEQWPE